MYNGEDKISSGKPHAAFTMFAFLKAADIFTGAEYANTIFIRFIGRVRGFKNYKSKTEDIVITEFD